MYLVDRFAILVARLVFECDKTQENGVVRSCLINVLVDPCGAKDYIVTSLRLHDRPCFKPDTPKMSFDIRLRLAVVELG